jgi:hypothetical protein
MKNPSQNKLPHTEFYSFRANELVHDLRHVKVCRNEPILRTCSFPSNGNHFSDTFFCVKPLQETWNRTTSTHQNRRPLLYYGSHTCWWRCLSGNSWYFLMCSADLSRSGPNFNYMSAFVSSRLGSQRIVLLGTLLVSHGFAWVEGKIIVEI